MGIADLVDRLQSAKLSVTLPKKLAEVLAKDVKPAHGARDVHRVIEEKLEHHIANAILKTKKAKTALSVTFTADGTIQVK
jgi:ATP-dependent Clp protease ATP-binding subunit ClpA